ncbi:RNA-directed DNA polymerase [Peteryoungia desertarenae]|uniref:RNA-directed DNA polymerase n=1 Tax=Peteryoungia desertarenae TaxID=1813451 RepID=A0ABX6QMF1_9HYPH|nr:RNA-directed DNA polymerase [Peteryoungia desertarenae]QLF69739.1 RNA-directed DNA polymerase [Peteryoungia desertarenae]
MKKLTELTATEAKAHFLKDTSYFNGDFPEYLNFGPIITDVAAALKDGHFSGVKSSNPDHLSDVNHIFLSNKDGRFAWRPLELIHPVIYVSLVNLICDEGNWKQILAQLASFEGGAVDCCSSLVMSVDDQSDQAAQIQSWWQQVEQSSLLHSLDFTHILHTDVTDCYGSLYTHSIAWALHGLEAAKKGKTDKKLLGNQIDGHIQASRYGQTNGIPQGSVLMDFIAEIVLGYVDHLITEELGPPADFRILRYRDDYRIFTNSDEHAVRILKVVSDTLRTVGMKLGVSKTVSATNVIEGSIKPDKLAGIDLQDLGEANAKTIQKQLMRLHAFGRRFPNSGALKRLVGEMHTKIAKQKMTPDDLGVQVAIATDIAMVSPGTFPAVAGILSHLISIASQDEKEALWGHVHKKMSRLPYNGYLEIWLQRVTKPKAVGLEFVSKEPICQIVNGKPEPLWNNDWIGSKAVLKALDVSKIVVADAADTKETIEPEEIELFIKNAWSY